MYIEEAHASDGWKFKNNYDINSHVTTEDRRKAALQLKDLDPHCEVVMDTMTDEANKEYGGLYERLYIVLDGVIVYEGNRGPMGYHVEEVYDWLKNYFN